MTSVSHIRWALLFGLMMTDGPLLAQTPPDHCWVKYTYDQAGNRITRQWWCGDPTDHEDPGDPDMIAVNDIGVRVYPNPTDRLLTVSTTTVVADGLLRMLNTEGRVVLSQSMRGDISMLDVSGLANGLYILELKVGTLEYMTQVSIVR
jgi:YD repeat-containing protein